MIFPVVPDSEISQYKLDVNWKPFPIHIPSLILKLKESELYCGLTTRVEMMHIHFLSEPAEQVIIDIVSHIESLDEDTEASKIL
jgi:hypothetical protein